MIKKNLLIISFFIVVALVALVGPVQAAGGIDVTLTPGRDQLAVGDPVELTLEVTHPAGAQVIIPRLDQTWGDFEVREQSPVTTSPNDDGTESTRQTMTVTLFKLGEFETPALPLTITDSSGQITAATAPVVSLTVQPLRAEADSALRDIRPQVAMALPSLLPALMAGLALATVVAGSGWWLFRRWRQKNGLGAVVDNRPPWQVAYDELDRIAGLQLPAQGQFKAHYTLATDCLRTYLEQQFDLHAFDRTTAELRNVLTQSTLAPDHVRGFIRLFSDSDLVKFAKLTPEIGEAHQVIEEARMLVTLTKPRPQPTEPGKFDSPFGAKQSQKQAEVSA